VADSRPARGHGAPKCTLASFEGPGPSKRISASLEVSSPSRRIFASLEGSSPSSESPSRSRLPLDPRHLTCSPDRSIKCLDMPRAPGSKGNPHHVDLLTPPGKPVSTLYGQPAVVRPSPTLYEHCAKWRASSLDTVIPAPVLPPRRTPRKGTTTP
jgi:hypothetical protein